MAQSATETATSFDDRGRWVAIGLCLPRLCGPAEDVVERALPWLMAVLTELGALPPPGFVVDVALLLDGAAFDTSDALSADVPRLRAALGRYDDRVLGRLAADRRLRACQDAYARLDPRHRPLAVAVLVANLARRSAFLHGMEPGPLRQLARVPASSVLAAGFDTWRESPQVLDELAEAYEGLIDVGRSIPAWLTDSDVFTLENLEVLGAMGQRVAVAQIVDAAEAMAKTWPRRIKMKRRDLGSAATALEDESVYPAGGFTSVANHGALENLVTSELVYMDDKNDRTGIDLFDVRYAEGELLYYTRDEALIVRPRRVIAFVLRPGLASARLKDPGVAWQRGVGVARLDAGRHSAPREVVGRGGALLLDRGRAGRAATSCVGARRTARRVALVGVVRQGGGGSDLAGA